MSIILFSKIVTMIEIGSINITVLNYETIYVLSVCPISQPDRRFVHRRLF